MGINTLYQFSLHLVSCHNLIRTSRFRHFSSRQVLNLTRQCIQRHRDLVVPLIRKYSEEWLSSGSPIFRPPWWLSPSDPTAFTIEDEFLIGDEVGNVGTECPRRVIGDKYLHSLFASSVSSYGRCVKAKRWWGHQLLQLCNLFTMKSQQDYFVFVLIYTFIYLLMYFLQVLVAPITEKGQRWRDIYLPGAGQVWTDARTARAFHGGTVLRNYSAGLAEVPFFVRTS